MTRQTEMRCNCPQYIPAFLIDDSRCLECGKPPLRRSDIWCGDDVVTVQACDHEYANIGVFRGDSSTYYHVDLPSLKRQWRPASFSYTDLGPDVFDAVMAEYRADVLALIARLNGGQMALALEVDDDQA
jgi:hypothetical protein